LVAVFFVLGAAVPGLGMPDAGTVYSIDPSTAPPSHDGFGAAFLHGMRFTGAFSLDWRNVGPRYPDYETQVQDEVFLSDTYVGFEGPFVDSVPFKVEFNMPTSNQGVMDLYQLYFAYDRIPDVKLQAGKFLVPFGYYNQLYRPDDYLTVTRPLAFASPDDLDLVSRVNSPTPPLSVGYTDIGGRASYYPTARSALVPKELTVYVVNGLGETPNRSRTFPNPAQLGVPEIAAGGTNIDFGHQDNNLADNNNPKAVGGRVSWSLGDVRLPLPGGEFTDLKGVTWSASMMDSDYNLEGNLNYQIYDSALNFLWEGFSISSEYVYGYNQFIAPIDHGADPSNQPQWSTSDLNACDINGVTGGVPCGENFQINQGYYVQAAWPLIRKPWWGKRLMGALVFNQLFHRGPALDLFSGVDIGGTTYSSIEALDPSGVRASTRMNKYTAAVDYEMTRHFQLKAEYSYWVMGDATTPTPDFANAPQHGSTDIYQTVLALVMGF
jgi:hypothetical protein